MLFDYVMSPYLLTQASTTLQALWKRLPTKDTAETKGQAARLAEVYRPALPERRRYARRPTYAFGNEELN